VTKTSSRPPGERCHRAQASRPPRHPRGRPLRARPKKGPRNFARHVRQSWPRTTRLNETVFRRRQSHDSSPVARFRQPRPRSILQGTAPSPTWTIPISGLGKATVRHETTLRPGRSSAESVSSDEASALSPRCQGPHHNGLNACRLIRCRALAPWPSSPRFFRHGTLPHGQIGRERLPRQSTSDRRRRLNREGPE